MTPVTSSSLVPTSTSNESHTRSVELHARSRDVVQRVSHSCRRASRSFQIRNSRSRSTEDKRPPLLSEHHSKDQRKRTQRRSATMFAVFLLCVLRATFVHARTRRWAVRHIMQQCTTMTENKCCASMACGWCVAQTPRDGPKNIVFLHQKCQEIVTKLRPQKRTDFEP